MAKQIGYGEAVLFNDGHGNQFPALIRHLRSDVLEQLGPDGEPLATLIYLAPEAEVLGVLRGAENLEGIRIVHDVPFLTDNSKDVVGYSTAETLETSTVEPETAPEVTDGSGTERYSTGGIPHWALIGDGKDYPDTQYQQKQEREAAQFAGGKPPLTHDPAPVTKAIPVELNPGTSGTTSPVPGTTIEPLGLEASAVQEHLPKITPIATTDLGGKPLTTAPYTPEVTDAHHYDVKPLSIDHQPATPGTEPPPASVAAATLAEIHAKTGAAEVAPAAQPAPVADVTAPVAPGAGTQQAGIAPSTATSAKVGE